MMSELILIYSLIVGVVFLLWLVFVVRLYYKMDKND